MSNDLFEQMEQSDRFDALITAAIELISEDLQKRDKQLVVNPEKIDEIKDDLHKVIEYIGSQELPTINEESSVLIQAIMAAHEKTIISHLRKVMEIVNPIIDLLQYSFNTILVYQYNQNNTLNKLKQLIEKIKFKLLHEVEIDLPEAELNEVYKAQDILRKYSILFILERMYQIDSSPINQHLRKENAVHPISRVNRLLSALISLHTTRELQDEYAKNRVTMYVLEQMKKKVLPSAKDIYEILISDTLRQFKDISSKKSLEEILPEDTSQSTTIVQITLQIKYLKDCLEMIKLISGESSAISLEEILPEESLGKTLYPFPVQNIDNILYLQTMVALPTFVALSCQQILDSLEDYKHY